MAGGKGEMDDQAVCGIALQVNDTANHLIVTIFRK